MINTIPSFRGYRFNGIQKSETKHTPFEIGTRYISADAMIEMGDTEP
jgi:hypothetical protein